MLPALDVDAVPLRELFPQNIDDRALFQQLASDEYVFVANGMKQLTRQWEAAEKLTAIYFGPFWSKMTLWQQAAWLVAKWPQIDRFVQGVERGTIAEIKRNGKASLYQA